MNSIGSINLAGLAPVLLILALLGIIALLCTRRRPVPKGPIQFRYCPNCSAPLVKRLIEEKAKRACPRCSFVHWDNPIMVGVAVIPSGDGVVLVKRKYEPKKGMWALPGGFGDPQELPCDTAIREAGEDVSIKVEIDRLLTVEGSSERNHALVFYLTKPTTETPVPGSDALEAKVFSLDALPEIAFSSHEKVLRDWISGR